MAAAGVCIGYFICYGSTRFSNSLSWRTPYIIQSGIAFILTTCCFILSESPRWLVSKGRRDEAIRAIERLHISTAEAEKDFLCTVAQENPSLSLWKSFLLLFRRGYRARTILALFLLGMVQLSGIDGILYVRYLLLINIFFFLD